MSFRRELKTRRDFYLLLMELRKPWCETMGRASFGELLLDLFGHADCRLLDLRQVRRLAERVISDLGRGKVT